MVRRCSSATHLLLPGAWVLRRSPNSALLKGGLVSRGVGADARTRPVTLTPAATELAGSIVEPWGAFVEDRLWRLGDDERAELYRLLVKASGLWDDVWPESEDEE